ncbi:glucose/arabinose dehydrogenase [Solirubrobacter pauli]|uniref:Glucose/arabinose dehydrogenase n=1 Tax=Solirubrobacter pauli TaxID=166793 RepID=A0A660L5L5_9ACTN|nr:PQQ-dependent sugar dehydrogenase [Solirubrobacter pauli]RKQ90298.1 glucose/arabinose dehydrogenase [Solirubrobacter pauli]
MRRLAGLLVTLVVLVGAANASATVLPPGFVETTVLPDLGVPTAFRFAPDGRVFVASKDGRINVYDSIEDTTPTLFADLRRQVHDYWDRGLLGMTLDPDFAGDRPYVYVLYAYDKDGHWNDDCVLPDDVGCVVSGRLSRLGPDGTETVLIEDWCQQFPSHSVGAVEFGPDGQLYVSAGEGASFLWTDWGQSGNPCGDPPSTPQLAWTSAGGSLRAQSFNRPEGEAAVLGGALLRVDPDTGAASAGNPAIADPDPNRQRIIAYGFRNPFRFTFRPGTQEIWVGDVGADTVEEIDRIHDRRNVPNFGWPCYEGANRHWAFGGMGNPLCVGVYERGDMQPAYFAYQHGEPVVPGETCPPAQGSVSGLVFYTATAFPARYDDALFFSDFARSCIWVAPKGSDGLPDMARVEPFASDASVPVSLTQGPDGALYYADLAEGSIRRIAWRDNGPTARIVATPTAGPTPLTVAFDGTTSSDPKGRELTYTWDLDGDGVYGDSTETKPTHEYTTPGKFVVRVRVTDIAGQTDTASQLITAGTPPTVVVTAPKWFTVGETISFSATAHDGDGEVLPASALTWALEIRHCSRTDAGVCHTHPVKGWTNTASATTDAPDHEYPSHLLLKVTARDDDGLTTTRETRIDPRTVQLTVASDPPGLEVTLGDERLPAPFTRTVMAGSTNSVAATTSQVLDGIPFTFAGWSGGVAATGLVTAPASGGATYTARYTRPAPPTPTPTATATATATTQPPEAPPQVNPFTPPDVGGLPPAPKLLGAWGFDAGANRVTGRHGKALALTGRNGLTVRAPRLGTFTVEAWVYATRAGTVAQRGSAFRLPTTLRRRWTHLALTYDGTTLRHYRNGALATAQRRTLKRTTSPLRFGGFRGRLDDVRLYDGALAPAQLADDMRRAVR